ncbi:hypothetical protein PsorP6_007248 [Peronosclerospora sorghi]|uniref:Uncharacterized protein n=1 Tax=Peronosclerospora sorghi TaxID=230839 RepID=A0ACC0WC56_9STRA|nr:hypothetical protein PsorP6_007248 [Peronosclerospora sorghi]
MSRDDQMALAKSEGGACGGEIKMEMDPGLNPEETAMILTSLSKGFTSGTASSKTPSSDDDDMGELSDDEESGVRRRHLSTVSSGGKVHRVQQINFDGPKGSKLDFTDDAGFSHRFRNESNRVKSLVTKHISIEELRAHFDRPIIDVAKDFGICITLMKKICRRNGIKRWPHRQIRSLSKSIASMEAAMLSAQGSEREKYRDQILNLKMKRESVIADPNKDNAVRSRVSPPPSLLAGSSSQSLRACHQSSSVLSVSPRSDATDRASFPSDVPMTPTALNMVDSLPATPSTSTITGSSKGGRWTSEEHAAFLKGVRLYGKDWRRVAQVVRTRSAVQTRTHAQKYLLKFAGRFPFETDGMLKDDPSAAPEPITHTTCAVSGNKLASSMVRPTTCVPSSHTVTTTPATDDSMRTELWTVEDEQLSAQHEDAMAKSLTSSRGMRQ